MTATITLATKVTLLRMLGVPVFVVLLVYYLNGLQDGVELASYRIAALWVFIAVAGTDALDGYLARSRNEITPLGRALDPLADKALLLSGLVMLTRPHEPLLTPHLPIWFTSLAISRDVLLVGGYFLIHHFAGRVEVHPRWTGKLATVLQMACIAWVLGKGPERPFQWLIAAAATFTAAAGLQYIVDGFRQAERLVSAKPPH